MHSEKLKKLCCMALTALLAVSVCGCKASVDLAQAEAAQAAKEAQQAAENGTTAEEADAETIEDLYSEAGLTPAAEDDPLWADAEFELPAIAQLLAYKATFADTFNENDPSADDFWTVTAMGVVAIPPENATDPFKIVHAKEALVLDYSAALLPSYEPGDAAPKLEDVYGISGNPRSDIIDIDSLSINVESSIVLLGTDEKNGNTVMRVHIEDKEGLITQTDWDVLVERWGDGAEHALPLKVVQFHNVN